MIDIRRVFATTLAMLRERGILLVGMLVLFTVLQLILSSVLSGVIGASVAGAVFATAGMDDPASLLAAGGAMFAIFFLLFYVAVILLTLAQQAAMTALATPLARPGFGDALGAGFKSSLTLLGATLLLTLASLAGAIVWIVVAAIASLMGSAGTIANVLAALLFVPAALYLACRFAVLVPVVAVDGLRNPIEAIRRSWAITSGKVLGILAVFLIAGAIMLALVAVPFLLVFAGGAGAANEFTASGGLAMIVGGLLFIPVFVLIGIASAVLSAALHSVVGDSAQQEIEEAFA